ncbi:uncharacterized protein BX664DRAFT_310566 [Halteromyces radiatus]|uniref:uncharacterized protein n=1 Tax=Halteromyces radiatus TaxID=101107 RepID=UPI0022210D87|nr:uncharacterized protein BX664DRAFT_310566 [Halteromyces radiatus]KAI8099617.1 hypothetical protein BX664DRAFT_310566 [Halteromyces radiatus]
MNAHYKHSSLSPSTHIGRTNHLSSNKTVYTSSNKLDSIFENIASQIQHLDEKFKWKLELTIMDNQSTHLSELLNDESPPIHSLPSSPAGQSSMLSVSPQTQYPWDFVVPLANETWPKPYTDEIQHQLKLAQDRERHLQNIVHCQAEQIKHSKYLSPEAEHAITTMRALFLMMENEQKVRYTAELKLQQKKNEMLERKLKRLVNILHTVEAIEPSSETIHMDKESLLEERQQLLRKLHLTELRLSARDVEMDYIIRQHQKSSSSSSIKYYTSNSKNNNNSPSPDINKTTRRSPTPQFSRKGPPYLFQQQYSPKMRSSVRPSPSHRHHQKLSGLDSLGILADQMLSDPDFEHNKASPTMASSPLKQSTTLPLSKRSIDSANALLSIPMLSSSFYPIAENPEQENDTSNKKIYNVTIWTPEEDEQLRKAISLYGNFGQWDKIASALHGRSPQQCQYRWTTIHSNQSESQTPEPSSTTTTHYHHQGDARRPTSLATLLGRSDLSHPERISSPTSTNPTSSSPANYDR